MNQSVLIAIAAAIFAGISAAFTALNWYFVAIADDNMIEHEIFSRQMSFCESLYEASSEYLQSYFAFAQFKEKAQEGSETNRTRHELEMLRAANEQSQKMIAAYSKLQGVHLRGAVFVPKAIKASGDEIVDYVANMHIFYIEKNSVAMNDEVENTQLGMLMSSFNKSCQNYIIRKNVVVPKE